MFQCWTSTMQRFNRWLIVFKKCIVSSGSFNFSYPGTHPSPAVFLLLKGIKLHCTPASITWWEACSYPLAWNKEEWLKEVLFQGLAWTCCGTFWCTTCPHFAEPGGIGCCPARKGVYSTGFPDHTGINLHAYTSWNQPVESYLSLQFWLSCLLGRAWTLSATPSLKQPDVKSEPSQSCSQTSWRVAERIF